MGPTFHRLYRETTGGPIMADTSGGVIHVRFLSGAALVSLINKVGQQADWEALEGNPDAWSIVLDGSSKPDWEYKPSPDDGDGESPRDGDDGDGQFEPNPQGKPQQGDGEGSPVDMPAQGSGGDGEDEQKPVLWGEFGPFAQQVVTFAQEANSLIGSALLAVENVSQETDKRFKTMQASIDKVARSNKGGNGSGGAIVKVEIVTPIEIKMGEGLFHHQFPLLAKLVGAGMHVFLPGPPGTGKSHAAEQIAGLLGRKFGSISLGPTTPESRLWGGMDANGRFHEPAFVSLARYAQDHPESGATFCLDEMDNGHPGILATLNSAMANGWFTAPNGDTIRLGSNFSIVAAANTYGTGPTSEFSGRNRLDAATLDRFAYVPWDTDTKVEATLVRAFLAETENGAAMAAEWLDVWRTCRKNVETNNLRIFVTMRGAIAGSKLLSQGLDVDTVLGVVLLNKIPKDQAVKINPL